MKQNELIVNFALDWPIYLILYSVIGLLQVLQTAAMVIYHRLAYKSRF